MTSYQVRAIIEDYVAFTKAVPKETEILQDGGPSRNQLNFANSSESMTASLVNNDNFIFQKLAPVDLALVSWPPGRKFKGWFDFKRKPYMYDKRKISDTWIYVVDNGIDPQNPVSCTHFTGTHGLICYQDFTHFAPNEIEWLFAPRAKIDKTDDDPDHHGSCVASKAVGSLNGVSKASHLVVQKVTTAPSDNSWAFSQIRKDILNKGRQGKAVIILPMTSLKAFTRDPSTWSWEWRALHTMIYDLLNEQVFVVVAAGNFGFRCKEVDTIPALLDKFKFMFFFTAGAVSISGTPKKFS